MGECVRLEREKRREKKGRKEKMKRGKKIKINISQEVRSMND